MLFRKVALLISLTMAMSSIASAGIDAGRIRRQLAEGLHNWCSDLDEGTDITADITDFIHYGVSPEIRPSPDGRYAVKTDTWEVDVNPRYWQGGGLGLQANRQAKALISYSRARPNEGCGNVERFFNTEIEPDDFRRFSAAYFRETVKKGDYVSATVYSNFFLGLGYTDGTIVQFNGQAGAFTAGYARIKIFKTDDNKVVLQVGSAGEDGGRLGFSVRWIPEGLAIGPFSDSQVAQALQIRRPLRLNWDFNIDGDREQLAFTYDLSNPVASAAFDQVIESIKQPTIFNRENFNRAMFTLPRGSSLHREMKKAFPYGDSLAAAQNPAASGVTRELSVIDRYGQASRFGFRFKLTQWFSFAYSEESAVHSLGVGAPSTNNSYEVAAIETRNLAGGGNYLVAHSREGQRGRVPWFGRLDQFWNNTTVVYKLPDNVRVNTHDRESIRRYIQANNPDVVSFYYRRTDQTVDNNEITTTLNGNFGSITNSGERVDPQFRDWVSQPRPSLCAQQTSGGLDCNFADGLRGRTADVAYTANFSKSFFEQLHNEVAQAQSRLNFTPARQSGSAVTRPQQPDQYLETIGYLLRPWGEHIIADADEDAALERTSSTLQSFFQGRGISRFLRASSLEPRRDNLSNYYPGALLNLYDGAKRFNRSGQSNLVSAVESNLFSASIEARVNGADANLTPASLGHIEEQDIAQTFSALLFDMDTFRNHGITNEDIVTMIESADFSNQEPQ